MSAKKISENLTEALAKLARIALDQPAATEQEYSCRRLLREAATRRPLCHAAARTVIDIARQVCADETIRADRSIRPSLAEAA